MCSGGRRHRTRALDQDRQVHFRLPDSDCLACGRAVAAGILGGPDDGVDACSGKCQITVECWLAGHAGRAAIVDGGCGWAGIRRGPIRSGSQYDVWRNDQFWRCGIDDGDVLNGFRHVAAGVSGLPCAQDGACQAAVRRDFVGMLQRDFHHQMGQHGGCGRIGPCPVGEHGQSMYLAGGIGGSAGLPILVTVLHGGMRDPEPVSGRVIGGAEPGGCRNMVVQEVVERRRIDDSRPSAALSGLTHGLSPSHGRIQGDAFEPAIVEGEQPAMRPWTECGITGSGGLDLEIGRDFKHAVWGCIQERWCGIGIERCGDSAIPIHIQQDDGLCFGAGRDIAGPIQEAAACVWQSCEGGVIAIGEPSVHSFDKPIAGNEYAELEAFWGQHGLTGEGDACIGAGFAVLMDQRGAWEAVIAVGNHNVDGGAIAGPEIIQIEADGQSHIFESGEAGLVLAWQVACEHAVHDLSCGEAGLADDPAIGIGALRGDGIGLETLAKLIEVCIDCFIDFGVEIEDETGVWQSSGRAIDECI